MSRSRRTPPRKGTTKTVVAADGRETALTRNDYRFLAQLYHEYGPHELVRGVAALLETDQDLHVMDGVHGLSKRVHDVGDDLFRLAEAQQTTGAAFYGSA